MSSTYTHRLHLTFDISKLWSHEHVQKLGTEDLTGRQLEIIGFLCSYIGIETWPYALKLHGGENQSMTKNRSPRQLDYKK